MEHLYATVAVVATAIGGLVVSNVMSDRTALAHLGRRVASALGGAAYLIAVIWLNLQTAIAVLGGLTLLIIILKLGLRGWLRGTEGNRPSQEWSQITFAVAGTASLVIGWWVLGNKWLGFVPVAFLAWGDDLAGLIRDRFGHAIPKLLPSAAMLAVNLAVAGLLQPYWLGVAGAVAATVGERYRPRIRLWDDNLNLVAASLAVMVAINLLVT